MAAIGGGGRVSDNTQGRDEDEAPGRGNGSDSPVVPARARRSVRSNVAVLLGTQLVTWSISLVLLVALPRFLGSEAVGQLRLVSSVWMIAGSFAMLGTQLLVTIEVARRPDDAADVVAPTILARSLAFIGASIVVGLFVAVADYSSEYRTLFVIMGLTALITNVSGVATAALQGFENFALPSAAGIIDRVISTSIILPALFLGAGPREVLLIGLGSGTIHLILLYRFLGRYVAFTPRTSIREAGRVARRGVPFLLGAVAIAAYHEADTIVMSLLVDDEQIGWYAAVDRLVGSALFIPTIVMSALFPTFARLHEKDRSEARQLVDRGFRSLMLFSLPIGVGLAIISTPLVLLLFGEEFRQSGPVLAVLSIVLMLMFQTILIGNYAVATGGERFYFGMVALAVVATIPLDLLLIPWTNAAFANGAIGGALAFVVTESVILFVSTRRFAPNVMNRATAVRLGKGIVAVAVMGAAVWPVRWLFPVVPVAVGAVVYGVMLLILSTLDDHERSSFLQIAGRLRIRLGR